MTELNPIWNDPNGLDFTRATQVGSLPIRGEKRLVPVEVDAKVSEFVGPPSPFASDGEPAYEAVSMAASTLTDYVTIRIPSRGEDGHVFRFLINPHTVAVSRQTLDTHTMTRAGWQFGVWGEDTIDIRLSGTTAGEYFEAGLTDRFEEFSISYRNISELTNLFENNGYYFEGEEVNQQWYAPDFTRKRIKCHEDVELRIGNFIWYGMFISMGVTHSADTPYFNTFELNFLAWKEQFEDSSPWLDSVHNNVYRGHAKEVENFLRRPQEEVSSTLSQEDINAIPTTGRDSANELLLAASGAPTNLQLTPGVVTTPGLQSFSDKYPGSYGVLKP